MFASTWYQADAASPPPPSVSSSALPFSFALPFRSIPPPANPLEKLMEETPVSIVYTPDATGLLLRPLAVASAESVSVVLTETGPEYLVLDAVGVEPSVV